MPTPPPTETATQPPTKSTSSYFSYPVRYAVGGILRRLSTDHTTSSSPKPIRRASELTSPIEASTTSPSTASKAPPISYTHPRSTPPFTPPPLTPLTLKVGRTTQPILTRALAEEIRLLVPTRLELVDSWKLIYGLECHGASLATVYNRCEDYRGKRGGFVLVVKDGAGNVSACT